MDKGIFSIDDVGGFLELVEKKERRPDSGARRGTAARNFRTRSQMPIREKSFVYPAGTLCEELPFPDVLRNLCERRSLTRPGLPSTSARNSSNRVRSLS